MREERTHTWDMYLEYHLCPKCSAIMESRQGYIERREGFLFKTRIYQKELICPACSCRFTAKHKTKPAFGPLTGVPQPPEIDWS